MRGLAFSGAGAAAPAAAGRGDRGTGGDGAVRELPGRVCRSLRCEKRERVLHGLRRAVHSVVSRRGRALVREQGRDDLPAGARQGVDEHGTVAPARDRARRGARAVAAGVVRARRRAVFHGGGRCADVCRDGAGARAHGPGAARLRRKKTARRGVRKTQKREKA